MPERRGSENKKVVNRLKIAIEQSLPNRNPIFIVVGCKEKGWADFGLFYDPHPEVKASPQMIKEARTIIESLAEQHNNECGADHEVLPVLRRINEERQTESLYEATNLVKLATQNVN